MKKNISIFLSFIFVLAISCTESKKADHEHAHHDHDEHHHQENHAMDDSAVQLDNGERWEANLETNEGIDNMIARVRKEETEASADLKTLQSDLRGEFNTILQKCTMKGESHNQLHNYLHPLKEKIDGMDQASNDAEVIDDLEQYLNTYKNYFK